MCSFIQGLLESIDEPAEARPPAKQSDPWSEPRAEKPWRRVPDTSSSSSSRVAPERPASTEKRWRRPEEVRVPEVNPEPRMEDFDSIEQYLDALVSHDKGSGAGRGGRQFSAPSRPAPAPAAAAPRPAAPVEVAPEDFDSFESYLDTLVGQDSWGKKEVAKPSAASKQQAASAVKLSAEDELGGDAFDLESFLDSLEDTDFDSTSELDEVFAAPEKKAVPAAAPVASKSSSTVKTDAPSVLPAEGKLDAAQLDAMTVKDLKDLLRGKGLPMTGKKADMVARLL